MTSRAMIVTHRCTPVQRMAHGTIQKAVAATPKATKTHRAEPPRKTHTRAAQATAAIVKVYLFERFMALLCLVQGPVGKE